MMRVFVLLIGLGLALGGCTSVESHKQADGGTCHDITLPAFHYSDCPAPGASAR